LVLWPGSGITIYILAVVSVSAAATLTRTALLAIDAVVAPFTLGLVLVTSA